MKIYLITPAKPGPVFAQPELTASEWAANTRKAFLMSIGYTATTINAYEVKTQGANFNTVATIQL